MHNQSAQHLMNPGTTTSADQGSLRGKRAEVNRKTSNEWRFLPNNIIFRWPEFGYGKLFPFGPVSILRTVVQKPIHQDSLIVRGTINAPPSSGSLTKCRSHQCIYWNSHHCKRAAKCHLDIINAFDSVNRRLLLSKLWSFGTVTSYAFGERFLAGGDATSRRKVNERPCLRTLRSPTGVAGRITFAPVFLN